MVLLSRLVCREFPQTFNSSKRPTVSAVSKEVSVLHAGAPVAFPFLVRIDSSACLTTALPFPSRWDPKQVGPTIEERGKENRQLLPILT